MTSVLRYNFGHPTSKLIKIVLTSVLFLFLLAHPALAGKITLTTYYPAPKGSYDRLTLMPQATMPAPCKIGTLRVEESTGFLKYCHNVANVGTWGMISNIWTESGNYTYPTATATKPSLFWEIGTTTRSFKLSLDNDGGILAIGTFGSGTAPNYDFLDSPLVVRTNANPPRFLWYPGKAAFRAGVDASSRKYTNAATIGDYSVALGKNNAARNIATVAAGQLNNASANYATIAGGDSNTASGLNSTVTGGKSNTASGSHTVASGQLNRATSGNSTVSGGLSNAISWGSSATISGGSDNTIGGANTDNTYSSTITGGELNKIFNYTLVSGMLNQYTVIGGGKLNTNKFGSYTTIGGGKDNLALWNYTYIGGGYQNNNDENNLIPLPQPLGIDGTHSVITGGNKVMTIGMYSVMTGGNLNYNSGNYATVLGGYNNINNGGNYSVILGGKNNRINNGSYSVIAGSNPISLPPGPGTPGITGDYNFTAGSQLSISGTRNFLWGQGMSPINVISDDTFIIAPWNSPPGPFGTPSINPVLSIGETNPTAVLNIKGNATVDYLAVTNNTATPGDFFIIKSNGHIGIGNINPGIYPLRVGNVAGPQGVLTSGGVWTVPSSRKFKDHINPLNTDQAIDALRELQPMTYVYKINRTEHYVGFIAEDVPELVASEHRDTVNPMGVTAVLTSVLQEHKKEIADQEKKLNIIENELKSLNAEIP